ncbi:expressed unknown protein [Seminavis robusta]|uniref:Potassium channel tetramerisation-type BTB domain-containing protein n=1 Tax=Seminavis robusta TaxID=568900 RepID=A0A9N8HNX8_9STRA|nr:expressed unknown protein [Seminavis robusta]|eukprot:Sro1126_g244040.1 n/a (262) ;mRNA; r:4812-5597
MASLKLADEVLVRVGGRLFTLSKDTISKLETDFLSKLVDPDSNFQKPKGGVFIVQAGAAEFSAMLHLIEYGSFPAVMLLEEKEAVLLREAAFWGVEDKVKKAVRDGRMKMKPSRSVFQRGVQLSMEVDKAKRHHNQREDDNCARIYCTDCYSRDIDDRFGHGDSYTQCYNCKKDVKYNPKLGWCHKCRLCRACQGGNECLSDRNRSEGPRPQHPKSTTALKTSLRSSWPQIFRKWEDTVTIKEDWPMSRVVEASEATCSIL